MNRGLTVRTNDVLRWASVPEKVNYIVLTLVTKLFGFIFWFFYQPLARLEDRLQNRKAGSK